MFSHFIFTVSRWWYYRFQETEAQTVPCTRFAYQESVKSWNQIRSVASKLVFLIGNKISARSLNCPLLYTEFVHSGPSDLN